MREYFLNIEQSKKQEQGSEWALQILAILEAEMITCSGWGFWLIKLKGMQRGKTWPHCFKDRGVG